MDFNGVFGRESSPNQCQLTVGYRLDGSHVNPLHVFGGASTVGVPPRFTFTTNFVFFMGFPYSFRDDKDDKQ
jgi:hypothetical protein